MKQKFLTVCAAVFCCMGARAQMAHYYIGTSTRNEVALSVKALPDGSSVIAGYIYDFDAFGNQINEDNLCMRVRPNGTLMWQQEWGTTGSSGSNDRLEDMIITNDGNFVVCAGVAGSASLWTDNTAAVYKLDINTGTIVNQYFFRASPHQAAGDAYHSVCETANGDFVAVGGTNFTPTAVDGLVSLIDGTSFTGVYDIQVPASGTTDGFNSVVADGNMVYMTGVTSGFGMTLYDHTVAGFDPYAGANGNFNWFNRYDFSYTVPANNGGTVNLACNFPYKIMKAGKEIMMLGSLMDDYGTPSSQADRAYTFTCDKAGGSPQVRIINTGSPANFFDNRSALLATSADDIYISNTPSSTKYFWENTNVLTGLDIWTSHIQSLSAPIPTVTKSISFPFNKNETVLSMDFGTTYPSLKGYLIMAGNAQPGSRTDNDIYYSQVPPSLQNDEQRCSVDMITTVDNTPPSSDPIMVTPVLLSNAPFLSVFNTAVTMTTLLVCGTPHLKENNTDIANTNAVKSSLVIAPNPATTEFNFFYAIPTAYEKANVVVSDLAGRVTIISQPVTTPNGSINVKLPQNMPAGVYLCTLYVDGKPSASQKLQVQ